MGKCIAGAGPEKAVATRFDYNAHVSKWCGIRATEEAAHKCKYIGRVSNAVQASKIMYDPKLGMIMKNCEKKLSV